MPGRALVLGGGGVTGVAWEIGIIAGLSEAGITLGDADLVVGTSAGSVVTAQLTSGLPIEELYQAQLQGPGAEVAAGMTIPTIARYAWIAMTNRDERRALARIGAMAVGARTIPAADRRDVIASRLPSKEWPAKPILITAVAADDGEFVAFDSSSGVSLVDAVAASCAVPGVWPTVLINGRRYLDGGVRSPANVDLVGGTAGTFDRVVVLAPISTGLRTSQSVSAQVAALRPYARAVAVSPDQAARTAIGRNVLDPARRALAAAAGRRQAADVAEQVAEIWLR